MVMSDTLVVDRIESNLTRLRLPRMREILQGVVKAAEDQGKSYVSFLDDLLEEEVARKEQRRVETALKISGLPFINSTPTYNLQMVKRYDMHPSWEPRIYFSG
jgi:DNA replication protein DnaC